MATISYYGLPSVQSDLTPVLGGNLNSNGKSINNALNVNASESSNNTIGTAGKTTFLGNGASLVGLQPSGAILTALNAITGSGLVALKQDGSFVSRGIEVSLPLTITNPSGVGGNPTISMNAASVVNNGYMVALDYYKLSGINAGVWVLGEDGTSDFYGSGSTDAARGANLLLAVGFLTENQEVIVGVGKYDVGANQLLLPKGGKIKGQGPNKTYIKSSLNSSSLASLALASGSVASDFTFLEHNGVNVIGGASADNTFTGAVVENVYITGSHPASGTLNGISLNTPGSGELTLRRVYINSDAEGVVVGGSNFNRLRSVDTEVNVYGSSASRNHGYRIKNNGSGCGIEIFGGYTTVSGNIGAGNIGICNEGSGNTSIKVFNHAILASGTGNTFDTLGRVHIGQSCNKNGISITNVSGTLSSLDTIQRKSVTLAVVGPTTNVTTGDGKFYFVVPSPLSGLNIVRVHAATIASGTTGTTDIQIARLRSQTPVDVLSTKVTIDTAEMDSSTAGTPAVINTSNDDLITNDVLRVDIDSVTSTPPQGLIITIEAQ